MSTYGTVEIAKGGRGLMASADGTPRWKAGGITVDWATVTALAADFTLPDGRVVKSGQKYLRYGKVLCRITATGKYGPYDAAAADGRQTLARGNAFILNESVVDVEPGSDHPAVFDAGRVWLDRVTDIADVGTHQKANPTRAAIDPVMDLQWVDS